MKCVHSKGIDTDRFKAEDFDVIPDLCYLEKVFYVVFCIA